LDPEGMIAFRRLLVRNQNGVGRTEIDFDIETPNGDVVSIDRTQADAGLRAITALNIMEFADDLPERESLGRSRALWSRPVDTVADRPFRFVPSCMVSCGAPYLEAS
jgi:hypothetical protein